MKEQITRQSIQLFGEKGFTETSIQDIVDALGVTKGTFYYYFSSKKQLLADIHLLFIDDILTREKDIFADTSKNSETKIYEIVNMLITSIKKRGAEARVFLRDRRNLDPDQVAEVVDKRDQFRLYLQKVIEIGIEKKELRDDLRPDIVAFAILGVCNWSYFWFDPDGPVSDEEVASIYVKMILNGLER
ncbi:TetR/AcrR family transcriptional regulator [Tuberibacillus sp. Marseille-P3662]|uniref:TetR/AcrR family transcriptional regulator n=1 Tax=Tuberibacillus sp. Marseille-P3662 TaxID=1965358 RepID=UPI000A1C8EE6|nr:TetR/AcrR family transcriptional regulator [Tuberibacillus sp. Marseille-P3662]